MHDKNKDDLLVELIANPKLTYEHIGRRVGLPEGSVGRIARGETRKDLRPKIRAAMKKFPFDKRRRDSGKIMRSKKRLEYNDDLLIELIVRSGLSYKKIARRIGISQTTVHHIASGLRRPDLQQRLRDAFEEFRAEIRRLGDGYLKRLLKMHIQHGLNGDGESARKSREYVMDKFLDPPKEPEKPPEEKPLPTFLTAEDYKAIAKVK